MYTTVYGFATLEKNPGGTNAYTIKGDLKSVIGILIKKMTILNQIFNAGSEMWTHFSTNSFHFMMSSHCGNFILPQTVLSLKYFQISILFF